MEQFFLDFFEAISPALQALLISVFTALVGYATAWVKKQVDLLKAKLTREQQVILEILATKAVSAAEQIYKSDQSQEKKAFAIAFLERNLEQIGLTVDFDTIVAEIESAVFNELPASSPFDNQKG